MRFAGVGGALTAGLLIAQGVLAQGAPDGAASARQPETTARLIVKLRLAGDGRARAQALGGNDGTSARVSALGQRIGLAQRLSRSLGGDMSVIELDKPLAGTELTNALESLRADPDVEFAEIDQRRYAQALPDDPRYSSQWYLQAEQPSAVNFTAAWDLSTGSADTVIAVLDTGVRFDHPDLGREGTVPGGRLLAGRDFVSGESASSFVSANDGNGWDDDPSDPGDWITAAEASSGPLSRCDESDSSWHGTRVTGILGAISNNMEGIAGGTWTARILPVRVLGKCGGFDSDIIAAMRWAGGLGVPGVPANPVPAKVLNLSLGGSGNCTSSYRQAISDLTAAGVLVVAAAGNEHGPVHTPGNCPGALAVAGLRHVGTKVGYSSFGTEVGISAPAGNCVNLSGQPCLFPLVTTSNTGITVPALSTYSGGIGTSFAVPMVSAIAGLMHALNDQLGNSEIIARIKAGSRPFPAPDPAIPVCPALDSLTSQCNCTTTTCGAGMADAPGALVEALRPMARIAGPGNGTAGETITLDGSGSATARGRHIAAYKWSISGGAAEIVGSDAAVTVQLQIAAAGTVGAQLTVTDDLGNIDTATVSIQAAASSGGGGGGLMHPLLLVALLGIGLYRRRGPVTGHYR
ncbi:MAG: S8 family serine peptidase [Gammaproteobacteria bacterium]